MALHCNLARRNLRQLRQLTVTMALSLKALFPAKTNAAYFSFFMLLSPHLLCLLYQYTTARRQHIKHLGHEAKSMMKLCSTPGQSDTPSRFCNKSLLMERHDPQDPKQVTYRIKDKRSDHKSYTESRCDRVLKK